MRDREEGQGRRSPHGRSRAGEEVAVVRAPQDRAEGASGGRAEASRGEQVAFHGQAVNGLSLKALEGGCTDARHTSRGSLRDTELSKTGRRAGHRPRAL